MSGFQLPFGVKPVNPVPVDYYSGPYISNISIDDAKEQANLAILPGIRFQSMEVRLILNETSIKYWYRDGIGDDDLVEFNALSTTPFYVQGSTVYSFGTTASIYRTGTIAIGTSASSDAKLYIYSTQSGAFQIQDGTEATDYILTSNNYGVASWTSSGFITEPISLTYSGLQNLLDTNSLELGRRYILTDYLHKYQILGSDSGAITQYHTMVGQLYGLYVEFDNVPIEVSTGSIVTAISVPPGATITVNATFSVTTVYDESFMIFSPGTAANNANFGTIFAFQKQRYPNVPTDSIIYDDYSNIVMKKGGVINTDVYNGLPYMSMSALQNTVVQVEQLVLTAISDNQFSINAESLTYTGDLVEYLFDYGDILDEDGNTLGVQRNGFIISRKNSDLDIFMNKDWRCQRYRRYKIDAENWSKLTLSGASNSTLYTIGGANYGGVLNTSLDDGHKYLLRFPYELDMYLDFYSASNTDPFKNGELSSPDNTAGAYRLTQDVSNTYTKSIAANGLTYSNLKLAFDYPIIPMNGYEPKNTNKRFRITDINNTIFKDLNKSNGISGDYSVDIENIYDSTIGSGTSIISTNIIRELKSIDSFQINNTGTIDNVFTCYNGGLTNNGELTNCRFSGFSGPNGPSFIIRFNNSIIYNTIFGTGRIDSLLVSDCMINRSMFLLKKVTTSKISGNLYLTSVNAPVNISSGIFSFNNFDVYRQISSTQSKGKFGVKHTISSNVTNLQMDNYNPKLELVSKVLDINYGSLTYNIIGVTE